jgi:hypothetical protein
MISPCATQGEEEEDKAFPLSPIATLTLTPPLRRSLGDAPGELLVELLGLAADVGVWKKEETVVKGGQLPRQPCPSKCALCMTTSCTHTLMPAAVELFAPPARGVVNAGLGSPPAAFGLDPAIAGFVFGFAVAVGLLAVEGFAVNG